jgi:hypothetical protein
MAKSGGVSGLGLAVAGLGGLLMFTGIRDVSMLDAIRSIARGVTPTGPGPKTTTVSFTGDPGGAVTPAAYLKPSATGGHPEIAQAALRYLGTPYRWGGKGGADGLDCSGLVYRAILDATGAKAPLSSTGQSTWRGFSVVSRAEVGAGDVLWWPGHVVVALDVDTCVSAPRPGTVVRTEAIRGAGPVGAGEPSRCLRYNGLGATSKAPSSATGSTAAGLRVVAT